MGCYVVRKKLKVSLTTYEDKVVTEQAKTSDIKRLERHFKDKI